MGVGGKFWEILKPYTRREGPDYLREKRVAIDLSYWIVQHETAIKSSHVRKPHLRLTFFRTINLFSKFGAFPVFVVDGTPSPLKSRARISRFFRSSGIDSSELPLPEEGVSVERNGAFLKCVQECVELVELLGMPVLKANGEAEALCAQLNFEGLVDACITSDSDAFLFGASSVIKSINHNSKEPFECYEMSDIETGLGLKRQHLIAIALLVGNDHDLNGVQGIGVDTALRFVQTFHEDEILNGLREIGKGNTCVFLGVLRVAENIMIDPHENSTMSKTSHCSFCGHPGTKRSHFKSSCKFCVTNNGEGCTKKPGRFKCNCLSCNKGRRDKEEQKRENWQIKVCEKISMEPNFPNDDIIEMYLCNNHAKFTEDDGTCLLSWGIPKTDMVVDFLAFQKLWEPSYIRQRMLPILSTIYLREMAAKPEKDLLYGQYEFDSILRVKVRYGNKSYVIKWKKSADTVSSNIHMNIVEELDKQQEDILEIDESIDQADDYNVTHNYVEDGCWFLLTDENTDLVHAAFPDAVDRFLKEKELKESRRRKCPGSNGKTESVKSKDVQLNITEFYRSTKVQFQAIGGDELADNSENQDDVISKEKRKTPNSSLPKSVRRRLLFN